MNPRRPIALSTLPSEYPFPFLARSVLIVVAFADPNLCRLALMLLSITPGRARFPRQPSLSHLQRGNSRCLRTQLGWLRTFHPRTNYPIFQQIAQPRRHLLLLSLPTTIAIRPRPAPQSFVESIVGSAVQTIPVASLRKAADMPLRMRGLISFRT